jgi:hypothetical protein
MIARASIHGVRSRDIFIHGLSPSALGTLHEDSTLYDAIARNVAKQRHCTFVDIRQLFKPLKTLCLLGDLVHLNDLGHSMYANHVTDVLTHHIFEAVA